LIDAGDQDFVVGEEGFLPVDAMPIAGAAHAVEETTKLLNYCLTNRWYV
jgi:hypothetical protein